MHKFAALRRVFHSASRQGKFVPPTNDLPTTKLTLYESSTINSSSKTPTVVTAAQRYQSEKAPRRRSPSSIFQLSVPPIPAPLAEPIKATSNDNRSRRSDPSKTSSNPPSSTTRPPNSKISRDGSFSQSTPKLTGHDNDKAADIIDTDGGHVKSHTIRSKSGVSPTSIDQNIYRELRDLLRVKPDVNTFNLVKTVGTGSFGRVYMAKIRERKSAPPVAIKRLTKAAVMKQKQVDHVLSEKNILARVEHPFLVRMYTTFQDQLYLYIVMEYVEGGEFFTFLRKSKRLEAQSARFYAAHVTSIFEYLHPMNIIYRDLKPENLLITRTGYLKLTDFGFAKVVDQRTFTLCGTPEYIAPEVLLNKGHGKPVDWWTLGILVYEMIVGYPPFFDEDALGIYQKILAGKIVFPRFFHRDAKSLVKRLLTHDLTRRFGHVKDGISDVRGHRWFDGFDFDALNAQKLEPPYVPNVKALDDTSNFGNYSEVPDDKLKDRLQREEQVLPENAVDPFNDW